MSTPARQQATPVEIKRLGREGVEVRWDNGHCSLYPNAYLRDNCPCAGCRGARSGAARLPVVGSEKEIYPLQISVVGRYAVRISWSDQHDLGIYSYDTLRSLCPCDACHAVEAVRA